MYPERPFHFAEALCGSIKNASLEMFFVPREITVKWVPFHIHAGGQFKKESLLDENHLHRRSPWY